MPVRTQSSEHQAGVIFLRIKDGSVTWSVTQNTQARTHRFIRLLTIAISTNSDARGILPLRLVCLDGVHPRSLKAIESTGIQFYQIDDRVAIEWPEENNPPRCERRFINLLTVNAWMPWANAERNERLVLRTDLKEYLHSTRLFDPLSDVLHELGLDFEAWCIQHLPSSLAAHACGVFCLSAIQRKAWARKQTGMAILDVATDAESNEASDQSATADLLDVADEATGSVINLAVLNAVIDILRQPNTSNIDGLIKRHWAHSIANLGTRLLTSDPRTAVLVGWSAYICESGTTTTDDPAASTVSKYIDSALLKLGHTISELSDDPFDWRTEQLEAIYGELVQNESPSNRNILRAALASFHEYLVIWFDLEPLGKPLHSQSRVGSRVQANVVWSHELGWCIDAAGQCPDSRLGLQAQAMLAIAGSTPIRRGEIRRLHVRNISFDIDELGPFAEIEIARDAQRGRLKSLDSQRRLVLRDPQALRVLIKLIELRRGEGAPNKAFLFGDPANDSLRYRMAATENYVNSLLKCVTGQRNISLHTLRHTVISAEANTSWRSSATADVNTLELIAASAGHGSPTTTLRSYSHLYEEPLRLWMDLAIVNKVRLSTTDWSKVVDVKPNTLAQRVRRTRLTPAQVVWLSLGSAIPSSSLALASAPFAWDRPAAPPSSHPLKQGFVVGSVTWALMQMRDGSPDEFIGQRMHLSGDTIKAWRALLEQDLDQWVAHQFPRKFGARSSAPKNLPNYLDSLGVSFERMWQPKYKKLASHLHSSVDDEQLHRTVTSWRHCSVGDYISLTDPGRARELLEFLRSAGIMSSSLRVCIQSTTNTTDGLRLKLQLQQLCLQVFDVHIDLVPRDQRRGRPDAYLLWSSSVAATKNTDLSNPDDHRAQPKDGAADEIGGLIGWMVCIHSYLRLKGITS